jgi:coenzyme F420-reducing hydrogenase delta subunit
MDGVFLGGCRLNECNYITPLKGKRLHKSLTEASVKDMKLLIGRLYEMGAAYGAKGYELTSEERKAMNEYYKIKK